MVKQDLLTQTWGIPVLKNSLLSLLFIIFYVNVHGQSQIVCNDNVQVSLDGDCQARIRPDMILEGQMASYNPPFTIRVSGVPATVPYTHPVVTRPGNYSVTVTNSTGNSCWGTINVKDKLPPTVTDCACPEGNEDPECTFKCTDEAKFFAGTLTFPRPTVVERCGTFTTQTSDQIIPIGICGAKIIRRTYIYTDIFGNKSVPCVADYTFESATLEDVTPAYNNISINCGGDPSMVGIFNYFKAKLTIEYRASYALLVPRTYPTIAAANTAADNDAIAEATKYAYPTVDGVPLSGQVCNLIAAKSDTELIACNGCTDSKKYIRLWTILDWCTGTNTMQTQVIKAADEEAPTIQAADVTVSVDPWSCAGNFLLPAPSILHDNCSSTVTYRVEGPIGVSIKFNASSGRYLVVGAPKGVSTFTYVAIDCCKNESRFDINVTVYDRTAPVAVAKQNIVISLTTGGSNDGIAKLFTNSVDNGSYDSCSPVHLEIRREVNPVKDEPSCGYTGNATYNDDGHPNDGSSKTTSPNYDPDGGQYVKFCCADITNREGMTPFGIVKVWMRVWDDGNMSGVYGDVVDGQSDNYNETWVEVRVEDKLTPQIVCPVNITINCDEDETDLKLTGTARAFSNCTDLETEYTDQKFITGCNVGYILRTWRIKNRRTIVCTQRIDKVNPFPAFEGSIVWPKDLITDCATPAINDKPTWTSGPCDQIGVSLKSDTFYFEGNACMKILNKWTVINWCTYDPNASFPVGYYTHTQVVKIIDQVRPTLGSCIDRMFEINDNNDEDNDGNKCERRNLVLTMSATDQGQCASDWLKWVVFVDLWGDGTNDYEFSSFLPSTDGTFNDTNGNGIKDVYVSPTGQGGEVRVTLPEDIVGSMSNHKITWRVIDGCGNATTCTQNFMVVDKKKPTPYCLNISSALMLNGQVELWAVDFNIGSFDNCTPASQLLYTFNEANPVLSKINQTHFFKGAGLDATIVEYNAGTAQKWIPSTRSSGMVFDCDDLPSTQIKMTVWDDKLNYDFCTVTLNLNDNQGACGTNASVGISGTVKTPANKQLENAEVTLENGISEMTKMVLSSTGGYAFTSAPMHYDYQIIPAKNNDYLNGVSTLDLVMIQRHLLGINRFSSAYHTIAADVNKDNRVTASDLTELRKLILGIYDRLPNNNSWRFINTAQTFADINSPWPLVEKILITDLNRPMPNQNFVAVKVGDIDGNADTKLNDAKAETRTNLVMNATNEILIANVVSDVKLKADINDVYGMQFTLALDNAELVGVSVGSQKLSDSNVARFGNKYSVSWNDLMAVQGSDLITLHVITNRDTKASDAIAVNSSVISAELYAGTTLQTSKISLRFASDDKGANFALFQNEPNPFGEKTVISFELPAAADATLKVFDVTGKVVYNTTASYQKGMNNVTISKSELPTSGVMIYQIESGAYTATRKMIGLE